MKQSLLLFALLGVAGCGGSSASVNPYLFLDYPEKNRSIALSEMTQTVRIELWDRAKTRLIYGPFLARRSETKLSEGYRDRVVLGQLARPGNYLLVAVSWSGNFGDDNTVNQSNEPVVVQSDGQITNPDGTQFVASHPNGENIRNIRLVSSIDAMVGKVFSLGFVGNRQTSSSLQEIPAGWLKYEWIEGRNLMELSGNSYLNVNYRGLAPGKVRFRVKIDSYTSDILEFDILP
jgi:hypothetical protein